MIRIVAPFLLLAAPAAHAQEVFGGILAHGVDTPLTFDTGERGVDVQAGVRLAPVARIGGAALQPYAFGSLNTAGDTSFVAAGVALKVPVGGWFLRPGIGIAVHDGPSTRLDRRTNIYTDLGSRVLFEPELGIGTAVAPRVTAELTWTHLSHAQIFGAQNPGLDMIGARLAVALR
ncbi:acyloxyacyl hydrolase [Sphingomonas corticis]|jgi:hypothetical protein|uniref:Acyloxyacyl hydrolase n=1 Tax=Sphingomonas corticis TaxID=2722791 RepID=A0ABX1CHD2_9SPHN|nr:acyloxyacyl hydrolase [Sphingomonas corticis]NJR77421.1 acyloxyacyl hydrolase [Sphingomonas corticis]